MCDKSSILTQFTPIICWELHKKCPKIVTFDRDGLTGEDIL